MVFLIKENGVKNILFYTSILPSVEHLTIKTFFMLKTYKTLCYKKRDWNPSLLRFIRIFISQTCAKRQPQRPLPFFSILLLYDRNPHLTGEDTVFLFLNNCRVWPAHVGIIRYCV